MRFVCKFLVILFLLATVLYHAPLSYAGDDRDSGNDIAVVTREPENNVYITHSGVIIAEPWVLPLGENRKITFLTGEFDNTQNDNKDDLACIDIDSNNDAYSFVSSSPGDNDSVLWTQALSTSAHRYYYFLSGDFDGDGISDLSTFYRDFSGANPESDVRAKITYGPDGVRQTSDEEDWELDQELNAAFVKGRFIGTGPSNDAIDDIAAVRPVSQDYQARFYAGGSGSLGASAWDIASPSVTSSPTAFGAGDFNGDGKEDLALTFYDTDSETYSATVTFGNTGATSTSWNLGSEVYDNILFNDFDKDSIWDIAAIKDNNAGTRTATIFFGEPDGNTNRTSLWSLRGTGEVTAYLTGNFGRYKTTVSGKVFQQGGVVGLGGATLTLTDKNTAVDYQVVTSDANGDYSFTDVVNSTYTISISKSGHGFIPTSTDVTVFNAPLSGISFTSSNDPITYSISGRVYTAANPSIRLRGMVITATGGNATSGVYDVRTTTDSNGYYSMQVTVGSFDVLPSNPHDTGFDFLPIARSVIINSSNATSQDFTDTGDDECPYDPAKTYAGACGCGVPDVDADNDGNYDCVDACPDNPDKTVPGLCGCDREESDLNKNGVCDAEEPNYYIEGQVLTYNSAGSLVGVGGVIVHSAVGRAVSRTLSDVERDFPNETNPQSKVGTYRISGIPKGAYTLWMRTTEDNQGYKTMRFFDLTANEGRTHCPDREFYKRDAGGNIVKDHKGIPILIDDDERKWEGDNLGVDGRKGNGNLCRFDPLVIDRNLRAIDFKVRDCVPGWVFDSDGYCIVPQNLFAPTELTASKGTSYDYVQVDWNASSGAREYELYRTEATSLMAQANKKLPKDQQGKSAGMSISRFLSTVVFKSEILVARTTETSFLDKSAVPGVQYVYSVKAINSMTKSKFSEPDLGWRRSKDSSGNAPSDTLLPDCNVSSDYDRDGDGYSNKEEIELGTNPCDRGSYIIRLESPVYTKYNTYLNQSNYLELVSIGTKTAKVKVTVYNIFGKPIGNSQTFNIKPGSQIDVNIHAWVNKIDTYGLVKIEFNDDVSGVNLAGRLSVYREKPGQEYIQSYERQYSFVFTRELRNPIKGASYGLANTIDPQGTGNLIQNWIEIINLENKTKGFNIRYYNERGSVIYDRETAVGADGRVLGPVKIGKKGEQDIQGGHEFGQGSYLIEIIPKDGATKYFATITRYGEVSAANPISDYNFAIPLGARAGSGDRQFLPIANQSGSCWSQSNWINLVNTKQKMVRAIVKFRDAGGQILASTNIKLNPHAQENLNAAALLPNGEYGIVDITPNEEGALIANGIYYYHDCEENELQTAYGIPSMTAGSEQQYGTYNRYLGMQNMLTVMNLNRATTQVTFNVQSGVQRSTGAHKYSFAPYSSNQFNINDNQYRTLPDTYGTLTLNSRYKLRVGAFNTRIREMEGKVDFAMPTAVR
ncbi:MAG: carboxypeptidase regulatory-like domain-containing protein [Deltaproteobacteria bacterium]|nr:carboxypeptidase regulatory-like domain-containing protein [Deltaproteobacteria bacterium]